MRRASGPNVSLFPFLTVLLCASGTLIVLLIALSRHVRESPAELQTDANPPAESEDVAPPPSEPPLPIKPPRKLPVVAERPPRIVRLPYEGPDPNAPLRQRLEAANAEEAALRKALGLRTARRDELNAKQAAVRLAAAEVASGLRSVRDELARLRWAIAEQTEAERRAADESDRFQQEIATAESAESPDRLLPVVRTPDGVTEAEPVLVECTSEGATLQPHPVTVPTAFAGPVPYGISPLAAGVAAAADSAKRPYVLLIVRPDGLPAFYRAADALAAANMQFGYELLDAEAEIA
ncbi:MAG: hypothetical protein AAF907_06490, partial [Planctomycetota bacterium]